MQIGVERDAGRNEWQFSVTDNGIGMDMQYADKVFTIFQRLHTSEQYSGYWRGLSALQEDRGAARWRDLGGVGAGEGVYVLFYDP